MKAQIFKASALAAVATLASWGVYAQDDAAAEPAGPTPQEVAAQNMDELLGLVKQGQARASSENKAREQRFTQAKANQAAELKRAE